MAGACITTLVGETDGLASAVEEAWSERIVDDATTDDLVGRNEVGEGAVDSLSLSCRRIAW